MWSLPHNLLSKVKVLGCVVLHDGREFQTQYPSDEVQGMLDQTFLIATQGRPANNGQVVDPDWPACLACAIVDRKRGNVERSGVCDSCFSRYCWRP